MGTFTCWVSPRSSKNRKIISTLHSGLFVFSLIDGKLLGTNHVAEPLGKEKMRPSPGAQEPHGQGTGETGEPGSTRTVWCVFPLWSREIPGEQRGGAALPAGAGGVTWQKSGRVGRLGREEICCNFKNQGACGGEGIERCYGKRPEEDKTQLALPNRIHERTCLPWGLCLPRGCLAAKRDFLLSTESP